MFAIAAAIRFHPSIDGEEFDQSLDSKQVLRYPGTNNDRLKLSDSASRFDPRQKEFGAFLRSRRVRLTPAAVGLPEGFRRRTPGLRREEVALLAGVGTTWYTWLEQGREVRPSIEALDAIAKALRLDRAERRHLFTLANLRLPEPRAAGLEHVPDAVIRMLNSMIDQPAYVLGRRWDILAWNAAAAAVFGDFSQLEGDARNLMHMMFANPYHRRLLSDWDDLAPQTLAMFRADSAQYAGDPDFERLIALLEKQSPEFRSWWPRHDVMHRPSTVKRVQHPSAGQLVFEYMRLDVTDRPSMRLIICTPSRDSIKDEVASR